MIRRDATLVVTQDLHKRLQDHLFPGDGLEAAALLLCTIVHGKRLKLLARDIVIVPHKACARERDALTWPGAYVERAIDRAEQDRLAIIAVHSHPGGLLGFSALDDASDQSLMPALFHGTDRLCGSAIMTPDGGMRARLYADGVRMSPINLILIAGHDIVCMFDDDAHLNSTKTAIAFTSAMTDALAQLSVCIVGVSGTGSIVAEQLARLGFGEIILIDHDRLEARNLNRILNSTCAEIGALKVDMFADAIRRFRPDCEVRTVPTTLAAREAVLAASEADFIFSCVDTGEGRHIADRIAASFLMPLFDLGVSIPTRTSSAGAPAIAEVCGRIDYVRPGGATLSDRGVYTPATLEAEYLARTAPDALNQRIKDGYLRGLAEEAPAVITLNMRAASACVMEFIARAFPFRHPPNERYARTIFLLADGDEERFAESSWQAIDRALLGRGAQEPLLGLPALAPPRALA